MIGEKVVPLAAWAIDTLIGDPRSNWHPVVLIGNLIARLEKLLLQAEASPAKKRLAGLVLVLMVLGSVYLAAWLSLFCLRQWGETTVFFGSALLLSFVITPRSLAEAGNEIKGYLETGNLIQARYKVGWIVGRDTDKLDTGEITRATVETVAENIVDGITAPLFYFAIGGLPLAFLYRAVNTLDSMVGYRSEKYRDFGMVSARTDDVFNYIPARITGIILVAAAFLLGYNAPRAAKTILRDAGKHPSPNSGIPEAGVAGALGIQLGGLNYYKGVPSDRARMGDALCSYAPGHISATIRIMYMTTGLFVAGIILIKFLEV